MALANKCDICGRLYPTATPERHIVMYARSERYADRVDCCCPKCAEHIIEFIDRAKQQGGCFEHIDVTW